MAWVQQLTQRVDAAGGAVQQNLLSFLPAVAASGYQQAEAFFVIANRGTASAYLVRADDTLNTALEIPAGETRESGPFAWPGSVPTLKATTGADCYVTPLTRGKP